MKKEKKLKGLDLVKKIGYIIIIMLIFTPLSFLISNTITNGSVNEYANCSPDYYSEPNLSSLEEKTNFEEMTICENEHQEKLKKFHTQQFIIISIISILTVLILLFFAKHIVSLIAYGLFFGSALNTIIIIMKESSTSSLLASGLGIILFILLIIFINKNLKEKKK